GFFADRFVGYPRRPGGRGILPPRWSELRKLLRRRSHTLVVRCLCPGEDFVAAFEAPARDRLGLGRVEVPRITVTRMPENLLLQRTPSAKEKIASSGLLFEQVFLEVQCPARDFCGFIRVHRLAPGGSHDFIPKLARLGRSPAPAPARSLLLRGGSAAPVRTK